MKKTRLYKEISAWDKDLQANIYEHGIDVCYLCTYSQSTELFNEFKKDFIKIFIERFTNPAEERFEYFKRMLETYNRETVFLVLGNKKVDNKEDTHLIIHEIVELVIIQIIDVYVWE